MTDIKGKNVFLSGPMSGRFAYNVDGFMDAHRRLNELGPERVFNPAYDWCTELSLGRKEKPHEFYMRRCVAELVSGNGHDEPFYDVLVSLPGWQDSAGATLERSVAMACGIAVCDLSEVVGDD